MGKKVSWQRGLTSLQGLYSSTGLLIGRSLLEPQWQTAGIWMWPVTKEKDKDLFVLEFELPCVGIRR